MAHRRCSLLARHGLLLGPLLFGARQGFVLLALAEVHSCANLRSGKCPLIWRVSDARSENRANCSSFWLRGCCKATLSAESLRLGACCWLLGAFGLALLGLLGFALPLLIRTCWLIDALAKAAHSLRWRATTACRTTAENTASALHFQIISLN